MTDEQRKNLEDFDGDNMLLTITIAALSGLIVGGVTTAAVVHKRQQDQNTTPPIIVQDQVATEQQEIIKQLTNLDMLVQPCSTEYINQNSDLLCREMYCRIMTRGIDSQTSGQECEEISNVANSKIMIKHCETFLDDREECYEKYRERK